MSSYSSGMAARLRFAISTAAVPDILVVDEALSTGDAEFRARATERIEQIREAAGTIFVVSHSAKQIETLCSRALWMENGHLVMDGSPQDVGAAYLERYPPRKPSTTKQATPKKRTAPAPPHAGTRSGSAREVSD
jgi:teichoic acid transport system ATP-binding protein